MIELKWGDLVQVTNKENQWFGFLVCVTEPKSWGCQGYLYSPVEFEAVKYNGKAYVRIKHEDMKFIGQLEVVVDEPVEDEE